MKYYTSQISAALAEKLKEKGMPIRYEQTGERGRPMTMFAECFDWLLGQGIDAEPYLSMIIQPKREEKRRIYAWTVGSLTQINYDSGEGDEMTWHEAAEAAIEKALTLI